MKWALAGLTTVAIIVGGWFLIEPEPDPPSAAAVAGTSTDAELCRSLAREAFVMADGIKRQFSLHRAAHRAYTRKENPIPFGPKDKPGTVLYIWRATMHKGAMHELHYTELRGIMRARGCLAGDGL